MAKITKGSAIHDLGQFVRVQAHIINGAVMIADFTDSEVRALLLDMLQDEIDELRGKWIVEAEGNDGE